MAVFDQIFMEREYRCLDGLKSVRTIVDAGANVGYSSAYLLSRFEGAKVICLEPDPANFAALKINLASFGDRVHAVNGAVWSEPCTLDFKSDTMALGDEWGREVQHSSDGNVQAFDMHSIMKLAEFDNIDLLKMDIEGAEETVFSAGDLTWLQHVSNIVIELHGAERRSAFFAAVGDRFHFSECGELTVCLNKHAPS